jgi:hypothetical protein
MKAPGRNENEQTDMAHVIEYVRQLRDETASGVAFVHHTGHQGDHMRGSSDLESVWETRLTWERDGQAAVVTLKSEHREAEAAEPITYRIGWDSDTRSMRFDLSETDATKRKKASASTMADWISARGGATSAELRREFDITDKTERERRPEFERFGIAYSKSGKEGRYDVVQTDNATSGVGVAASSDSGRNPLNHARLRPEQEEPEYSRSGDAKSAREQGFPEPPESGVPTGPPSRTPVGPEADENELERLRAKHADIAEWQA